MKLYNFEKAFIDKRKLSDYCLDENHPAGKHKAVKFKDALLFTKKDTTLLKKIILDGVKEFEALLLLMMNMESDIMLI